LQLRAEGRRVPGRVRRRRNAAWHAAEAPSGGFVRASDACIASAAAGPRLDGEFAGAHSLPPGRVGGAGGLPGAADPPSVLRASAAEFFPAPVVFSAGVVEPQEPCVVPQQSPLPHDDGGRPATVTEIVEEEFESWVPQWEEPSCAAVPSPPPAGSWAPVGLPLDPGEGRLFGECTPSWTPSHSVGSSLPLFSRAPVSPFYRVSYDSDGDDSWNEDGVSDGDL